MPAADRSPAQVIVGALCDLFKICTGNLDLTHLDTAANRCSFRSKERKRRPRPSKSAVDFRMY